MGRGGVGQLGRGGGGWEERREKGGGEGQRRGKGGGAGLTCNGLQVNCSRIEVLSGFYMRPSAQIPPVLPIPLVAQMVDGDGGVWMPCRNAFKDLQLVGLLDVLDAPLSFFPAHLSVTSAKFRHCEFVHFSSHRDISAALAT